MLSSSLKETSVSIVPQGGTHVTPCFGVPPCALTTKIQLTTKTQKTVINALTYNFRNIFPLIYCLAGSILALYFPHYYIFSPQRDILWVTTLRLAHCEGGLHPESNSADSHSVDSCSADPSRYFTSFNYFGSVKKAGKHSRNCASTYKSTTHNVFYTDHLWTWQHSGHFISPGLHPRDIKSLVAICIVNI